MELSSNEWRSWRPQVMFVYGTGLAVGLYVALLQFGRMRSVPAFFFVIAGALLLSTVSLLLWRFVLPRLNGLSARLQIAVQVAVCVAVFSALSFGLTELFMVVFFERSMFNPYEGPDLVLTFTEESLRWAPLFYTAIPVVPTALLCIVGYNLHWSRIHLLQSREREMRELAVAAQLAALRAQVNPHFFFNSLNSVAQLISTDPDKAEACVERLAELFRYMLKRSDQEFVPFADELEFAEAYLEIEKARFGDSLEIEREIDDAVDGVRLPGLILQPLVENAVKHGISRKIGGGRVRIEAHLENEDLRICVRDTGVGMQASPAVFDRGVGLRNVRDRLVRIYGPRYEPTIASAEGEGTSVTLRIPADRTAPSAA